MVPVLPNAQLSEQQQAKIEALTKEYASKIAELRKQIEDVFTDEQKQARAASKKNALEDGKRGMALRAAVDAAANLTDEQKKAQAELQKVQQEMQKAVMAVLTPEQRKLVGRERKAGAEKGKNRGKKGKGSDK